MIISSSQSCLTNYRHIDILMKLKLHNYVDILLQAILKRRKISNCNLI